MSHWQSELTQRAKAGFAISWSDAVALCDPIRGSLAARANPKATQLLDQFACWVNEGGQGSEPIR